MKRPDIPQGYPVGQLCFHNDLAAAALKIYGDDEFMKRAKNPLGALGITSELLKEKSGAEIWQAMQDMKDRVQHVSGTVRQEKDGRHQYEEYMQEVSEKAKDLKEKRRDRDSAEDAQLSKSVAEKLDQKVNLSDDEKLSQQD